MWVKLWFHCRSFVKRRWCVTMRWILMLRCWTCLTPLLGRNRFLPYCVLFVGLGFYVLIWLMLFLLHVEFDWIYLEYRWMWWQSYTGGMQERKLWKPLGIWSLTLWSWVAEAWVPYKGLSFPFYPLALYSRDRSTCIKIKLCGWTIMV